MSVLDQRAAALALLLLVASGGCRRGPDLTTAPQTVTKPTAKTPVEESDITVVAPALEAGLRRLRRLRAFREWGVRETATDALARIGDAAVPALIETLHDADPSIRAHAAQGLARMGSKAAPAVPELISALNDDDREVRRGAARALGQIGPDADEAVSALIQALKDPRNKPAVEPLETEVVVPERVID